MAGNPNPRVDHLNPYTKGKSGNPGGKPKNLVKHTLDNLGKNPVEEILNLMAELPPGKRVEAWLELLSYMQGKPKCVLEDSSEPELSREELVARAKFAIAAIEKEAA